MPAAPVPLPELRRLLADRFPQAARPESAAFATGIPSLDTLAGGLPRSGLTECVSPRAPAGLHLLFAQLLATSRRLPARIALIDSGDQFDPDSFPEDQLEHLLWVRCRSRADALPAADLLVHDANFDLILLDLSSEPAAAVRRIPAAVWYRLDRAVGRTTLAFLVATPAPTVPCAGLRFALEGRHPLTDQARPRPELIRELTVIPQRQRQRQHGAASA